MYENIDLEPADIYKYLGVPLYENLVYNHTTKFFSNAGGRALGSIIANFKTFDRSRLLYI